MTKKVESIAVFGASTTYGYVDESGRGGWVGRFREWFEPLDPDDYAIFNLGIQGDTSTWILDRIGAEASHRNPDLIILSIGVNDASRRPKPDSRNVTSLNRYGENLQHLIRIAKKHARYVVFVSAQPVDESKTTPVSWCPCYYFARDQSVYHGVAKAVCQQEKVPFLDLMEEWQQAGDEYKRWLYDGLHPNAAGHERIFQSVKEFLMDLGFVSKD